MKANGAAAIDNDSIGASTHVHTHIPNTHAKVEDMPTRSTQQELVKLPTWLVAAIVGNLATLLVLVGQNFYWKGGIDEKISTMKEAQQKYDSDSALKQAQFQHLSEQYSELKGKFDTLQDILKKGAK